MRRIIVSMNVTLDGLMAGPDHELDWHTRYWDEEMANYLAMQLSHADTLLLGRITYNAMAHYWPSKAGDYSMAREDIAFAEMMNSHNKVVVSATLTAATWNNSRIISGNVAAEVRRLKRAEGADIIIYGSGDLVAELMRLHMIDEYMLWVHPVVLGRGRPFFTVTAGRHLFRLVRSKAFASGVLVLNYRPAC